ncbi:MAG: hypothetical protein CW348_14200 [Thermobifida sp.]|jgi:hypothetical protein|nr:hypothetical protein [Thermobifida sp.]PZN65287.1 MAG: hypothetical protein DIU53_04330 [Thermobifida fusca]
MPARAQRAAFTDPATGVLTMPEPMLPTHPDTGLTAIGLRRNGAPIWPVIGGAEDTPDTAPGTDTDLDDELNEADVDEDQDDEPDGAAALGDPGKRALDAMKTKWRTEREKRRAAEAELSKQRATPAEGDEPDAEAIRQQAEQAAVAKANARIVRAEVRAAAAGRLADPGDALRFLDAEQFEVDADGNVDADELADAIGELLKSKPYLAAHGGRRFQGTGDGGARKGSRPSQITSREDLAKMQPAERLKAHTDGRLRRMLQGD